MSDNLRDRIAKVSQHCREHKPEHECVCSMPPTDWDYELADAVIAALGTRRCERCRHPKPLTDFPDPHEGSDEMRPFCTACTGYVEWATS